MLHGLLFQFWQLQPPVRIMLPEIKTYHSLVSFYPHLSKVLVFNSAIRLKKKQKQKLSTLDFSNKREVSTFIRLIKMLKLVLQQSQLDMALKYFENIFIRQFYWEGYFSPAVTTDNLSSYLCVRREFICWLWRSKLQHFQQETECVDWV